MPLAALEAPDEINRFKTDSEWAEDVEIASIHRVLERLRAAMNWGMAQTPPLFARSPFHRFGVRMNKKAETVRDRRVSREEEKRLLDTALLRMNTAAHMFAGELLHDRIIGALELCCRRGEMLLIQNKRVNWETYQIGIPGATAKDKENRRIPFNPKGRLAAILKRRAALGPDAFVFGSTHGAYQPTIQTAWETLKLLANGIEPKAGRKARNGTGTATPHRPAVARPQARGRLSPACRRRRHPHHPADARPREHSADAALPERDGRRTAEGTGGELGPAASGCLRTVNQPIGPTDCPQIVPAGRKFCEKWLLGLDSNQQPSG